MTIRSTAPWLTALTLLTPFALAAQPADVAPPPAPPAAEPQIGEQPPATSQPDANGEPNRPGQTGPSPGATQPDDIDAQQSTLRRDLEQAQQALEQAARDVARLSAELAEPVVDNVRRQFRAARPRAMLGLNIEGGAGGIRIVGVSPNGPAAAAGLRTGDVVVAVDGERLDRDTDVPSGRLLARMRTVEPGQNVVLTVSRAGREADFTVTARELDFFDFERDFRRLRELPGAIHVMPLRSRAFGAWRTMELVPLTPELGRYFGTERGLLVVRAPDSDALGLMDGDVILDIGGREPTTPEHAMRILSSFYPGETLRVTIMRDRMRETLEVELPED